MPAPICVKCQLEMRCAQNDRIVNDVRAGDFPSTYWRGDLFRCPQCNTEVVVGFGREMGELAVERMRKNGAASSDSLVFAHEPQQLQKYADQFEKRSETP